MSRITKNYIYNLIYQLFVLIVPIITAPYLARVLGPNSQGISSYVVSMSNIISTITLLGIYNYGNRQIAYERDNRTKMSQTFWEIMIARVIFCILGSIIFFIVAKQLKDYTEYFLIYYLWILAAYLDCTWLYVGLENMKTPVIKNFFAKLITVLGIFIFVRNPGDTKIYLLLLGGSVLIANIWAYSELKKYIVKTEVNLKKIFIHIQYSVILFLPTVATLIYLQVDKVMLESITGQVNQVSFYDNAEKIVTIPLTFITVLSTVMMPRIANEFTKGNIENIRRYIIKAGEVSLFLAFPMAFGLFIIANKFVPWYLGNEYSPVIYSIMFICPIIISNSLEGISGKQYFTATNQINILVKTYSITAIMNFIINLILIPEYGVIGAAIATLISSYVCVIMQFIYLNKQINIKKLFIPIIKYFFYSVIMITIVYLSTRKMAASPLTTLIQITIGGVTYILTAIVTKDKILSEIVIKILNTLNIKIKEEA